MMWVDISLLVISIILMVREFFPRIEDLYKKRKKLVHIILIVGMFGLSITNIILTNNENKDLIKTAKNTLTKIDSVYINQVKSDSTLQLSVNQIKKVDTVLGIVRDSIQFQVKQLDTAINKSKELARLEALDFESKKAELTFGTRIETMPSDSSKFKVVSRIRNIGRKAVIKYSYYTCFIVNKKDGEVRFLETGRDNFNSNLTTFELETNKETEHKSGSMPHIELNKDNHVLFYIYTMIYEDFITKKIYKEVAYEKLIFPFTDDKNRFIIQKPNEVYLTDKILKEYGYYKQIYPPEFY